MKVLFIISLVLAYAYGSQVPIEGPLGRIVNGELAAANQFPWQVGIRPSVNGVPTVNWCGGSVIAPNWILTSASCVTGRDTFNISIGSNNINAAPVVRQVTSSAVTVHADYVAAVNHNDVAVIYLPEAIPITESIQVIQLPRASQANDTFVNAQGVVAGFGRNADSSPNQSELLRFVNVRVIANAECRINYQAYVGDFTICTRGSQFNAQSICGGDYGSALAIRDNNGEWMQIGGASFISEPRGCASGLPGGYSRTPYFLPWINAATGIPIRP